MEWAIDYMEEDGIVLVKLYDPITWDEIMKMTEEALSFGHNNKAHSFLIDHRNAETHLSILQLDELPHVHKAMGVNTTDKIAVLYKQSDEEKVFKFIQSVYKIASFNYRVFTDENGAIAWLKSGE